MSAGTSNRQALRSIAAPHGEFPVDLAGFRTALLGWYSRVKRDLPWRRTSDPYRIWLSEIMLQQTRVETVIPYYERFIESFPTVQALADAPVDAVLTRWAGLGYYSRARNLHRAAVAVSAAHGGKFPANAADLRELPGVGRYTAAAIASIAFGKAEAVLDGNVQRVLARVYAIDATLKSPATTNRLWTLAEATLDRRAPGAFNQAMMELGATVCTPRQPACLQCPVRGLCGAAQMGRQNELPRMPTKAASPTIRAGALATWRRGRLLMMQRVQRGLLGGLWELPRVEFDPPAQGEAADFAERFSAAFGLRLGGVARRGEIEHIFTHRRLLLSVYSGEPAGRVRLPADSYVDYRWCARTDVGGLALSTLARKSLGLIGWDASAPAAACSAGRGC